MGVFDFIKKKRPRGDPETLRRQHLTRVGRITDGTILEGEEDEAGEIVRYFYTVQGVDYESSEILNEQQRRDPLRYAPGARVGVRYDPRNHGNSMLE